MSYIKDTQVLYILTFFKKYNNHNVLIDKDESKRDVIILNKMRNNNKYSKLLIDSVYQTENYFNELENKEKEYNIIIMINALCFEIEKYCDINEIEKCLKYLSNLKCEMDTTLGNKINAVKVLLDGYIEKTRKFDNRFGLLTSSIISFYYYERCLKNKKIQIPQDVKEKNTNDILIRIVNNKIIHKPWLLLLEGIINKKTASDVFMMFCKYPVYGNTHNGWRFRIKYLELMGENVPINIINKLFWEIGSDKVNIELKTKILFLLQLIERKDFKIGEERSVFIMNLVLSIIQNRMKIDQNEWRERPSEMYSELYNFDEDDSTNIISLCKRLWVITCIKQQYAIDEICKKYTNNVNLFKPFLNIKYSIEKLKKAKKRVVILLKEKEKDKLVSGIRTIMKNINDVVGNNYIKLSKIKTPFKMIHGMIAYFNDEIRKLECNKNFVAVPTFGVDMRLITWCVGKTSNLYNGKYLVNEGFSLNLANIIPLIVYPDSNWLFTMNCIEYIYAIIRLFGMESSNSDRKPYESRLFNHATNSVGFLINFNKVTNYIICKIYSIETVRFFLTRVVRGRNEGILFQADQLCSIFKILVDDVNKNCDIIYNTESFIKEQSYANLCQIIRRLSTTINEIASVYGEKHLGFEKIINNNNNNNNDSVYTLEDTIIDFIDKLRYERNWYTNKYAPAFDNNGNRIYQVNIASFVKEKMISSSSSSSSNNNSNDTAMGIEHRKGPDGLVRYKIGNEMGIEERTVICRNSECMECSMMTFAVTGVAVKCSHFSCIDCTDRQLRKLKPTNNCNECSKRIKQKNCGRGKHNVCNFCNLAYSTLDKVKCKNMKKNNGRFCIYGCEECKKVFDCKNRRVDAVRYVSPNNDVLLGKVKNRVVYINIGKNNNNNNYQKSVHRSGSPFYKVEKIKRSVAFRVTDTRYVFEAFAHLIRLHLSPRKENGFLKISTKAVSLLKLLITRYNNILDNQSNGAKAKKFYILQLILQLSITSCLYVQAVTKEDQFGIENKNVKILIKDKELGVIGTILNYLPIWMITSRKEGIKNITVMLDVKEINYKLYVKNYEDAMIEYEKRKRVFIVGSYLMKNLAYQQFQTKSIFEVIEELKVEYKRNNDALIFFKYLIDYLEKKNENCKDNNNNKIIEFKQYVNSIKSVPLKKPEFSLVPLQDNTNYVSLVEKCKNPSFIKEMVDKVEEIILRYLNYYDEEGLLIAINFLLMFTTLVFSNRVHNALVKVITEKLNFRDCLIVRKALVYIVIYNNNTSWKSKYNYIDRVLSKIKDMSKYNWSNCKYISQLISIGVAKKKDFDIDIFGIPENETIGDDMVFLNEINFINGIKTLFN